MTKRRWPRLVDDGFLIHVGLEVLCVEMFDELVARGLVARADKPDGTPGIAFTDAGRRALDGGYDLVEGLLERVKGLPERRRRERAEAAGGSFEGGRAS